MAAFRSAAAVLAPHGAALTSMLHMPTGAAVMELMHAENVNRPWFMLMAAKLQLDYWTVKLVAYYITLVVEDVVRILFEQTSAFLCVPCLYDFTVIVCILTRHVHVSH